jgi:hypothetical protein
MVTSLNRVFRRRDECGLLARFLQRLAGAGHLYLYLLAPVGHPFSAAHVPTVACQFRGSARVLAVGTAILLVLRRDTITRGMRTFLGFSHKSDSSSQP